MVTLHYNNSLIVHPDTRGSFEVKLKNNLRLGRCRFGINCHECKNFVQYETDMQKISGKPRKIIATDCQLYKHKDLKQFCPGRMKQKECGTIDKTFGIDFKTYNQIADRTAFMYHNRKNRLIFVVLSLPELKIDINGKQLNEAFSRFIENLRTTYRLQRYLCVREGDGLNTRYHYHCIFDIRYTSFVKLNAAWNSALSDFCYFSKCAFRTKKKSYFIRDIAGAISYISKYVSKSIGQRSESRVFFCDRDTANAFVKQRFDTDIDDLKTNFKTIRRKILNDFVCRYTFHSKKEQNLFFHSVVKILFQSDWITPGLLVYSDNDIG